MKKFVGTPKVLILTWEYQPEIIGDEDSHKSGAYAYGCKIHGGRSGLR
jgi:hypothetical protein